MAEDLVASGCDIVASRGDIAVSGGGGGVVWAASLPAPYSPGSDVGGAWPASTPADASVCTSVL